MNNGIQASIGVSGTNATMWEVDRTFNAAAILGQAGNFFNDQVLSEFGTRVNVIGTGCPPDALCSNRGTLTINFSRAVTDPIVSLAAIGGGWQFGSGWTEMDITTGGATLTKLAGANIQVVNSTHIEPITKNPSIECNAVANPATYGQTATAACGSFQVNGTYSSISFALSIKSKSNTANSATGITFTDAILVSVHVREDFGLAPVSYDSPAASHVVGPLHLGATVSADQISLIYPTTNADAVALGTTLANPDDGVSVWSTTANIGSVGNSYTVPIALTGVAATAKLCGWIDFNSNGLFDAAERACAVDPTAGDTTANLEWVVPNDAISGVTYARIRLSYSNVSSPTGKVDSGEVEDYSISIALTASSNTTVASSSTVVSNSTMPPTSTPSTSVAVTSPPLATVVGAPTSTSLNEVTTLASTPARSPGAANPTTGTEIASSITENSASAPSSHARVVDQFAATRPQLAVWLDPLRLGAPAKGEKFRLTSLRLWNLHTRTWESEVTTSEGVWTAVRGTVRFVPRSGFRGTTILPFHISDSGDHVVHALLHVVVQSEEKLPATGTSIQLSLMVAFLFLIIGAQIRRLRSS